MLNAQAPRDDATKKFIDNVWTIWHLIYGMVMIAITY